MRRSIVVSSLSAVLALAVSLVAGCSGSDDPADVPDTTAVVGLDRIDGPATVDPSYDPFTTDG